MEHYFSDDKGKSNFIFGIRPTIEAIKAGKEIDKVLLQNGISSQLIRELSAALKEYKIPFQYVPQEKLNRLSRQNHQGVIAYLSSVEYADITNIIPSVFEKGQTPLVLILDRITDVRNFGAISRTAECAGVHAIVIPSRGAAQINADAVKTSAGALHKIPVCRSENLKSTIDFLKESGLEIISCTEKAKQYHYQISFASPCAIIMGSEENGISGEYLQRSDKQVKIPMLGEIGSLNVSVAAGIILFEAVKQRISG